METTVLIIFGLTYLAIAIGEVPPFALDRTGIALLGAVAVALTGVMSTSEMVAAVDFSVLILLYALMIVSAQFRLAGFYTMVVRQIVPLLKRPAYFLGALMFASALLSALLANDIVCLAFTPIVCLSTMERRVNPLPFLLALAVSSNIGSATTIIGNPQNILIAQAGKLDFARFFFYCFWPSVLALVVAYLIIYLLYRRRFFILPKKKDFSQESEPIPEYNAHQTGKGLVVLSLMIVGFLLPVERALVAISVAAVLLCSRYMHTRKILGLIDWHLLTLFTALFVIVAAAEKTGIFEQAVETMSKNQFSLQNRFNLTLISCLLSNLVSNVPAAMILIKFLPAGNFQHWYLVALATTFAGNLFTIGSIANLIVIEGAAVYGIRISFREHLKVGAPVFGSSLLIILLYNLIT